MWVGAAGGCRPDGVPYRTARGFRAVACRRPRRLGKVAPLLPSRPPCPRAPPPEPLPVPRAIAGATIAAPTDPIPDPAPIRGLNDRRPRRARTVPLPTVSDVVLLERVSLSRGGHAILREIDWTVRDGERWAVLGPNGAGKTTLLEVATLYLYPSSGRVTVLGAVHGRTDIRPLRARIGYASAALARLLHGDSTALDAVVTGRTGVLDPYWAEPTDEDVFVARELLERLGAGDLAGHQIATLSEGERQRVQIARALMAAPDLLVLDEPSASLDLGAREVLVASLSGLARDALVRAIVFVTHHVEEIPPGFSHVLLLRAGQVVAAGPIAQTLTSGTLSDCFGLPLSVGFSEGRWMARAVDVGMTRAVGAEVGEAGRTPAGDRVMTRATGGGMARAARPEVEAARTPAGPRVGDREAPPGGDASSNRQAPSASPATLAPRLLSGLVRDPDGRLKAYRPLAPEARLAALGRALDAYEAGDFFVAHEILEPPWMGTDDQSERALYQGLIKVAAAGVHAVRGNPRGVLRNLEGAAARLARVPETAEGTLGQALGEVDLVAVRAWVDAAVTLVSGALETAVDGVEASDDGIDDGVDGEGEGGPRLRANAGRADPADVARLLAFSPAPARGTIHRRTAT